MKPNHLSRRTVLRGLGTSLTLPFLESLVPQKALAQAELAPLRLLMVYHPFGIQQDGAKTYADPNHAARQLALLESVRPKVNVLGGFYSGKSSSDVQGHREANISFLTSVLPPQTSDRNYKMPATFDQVIANSLFSNYSAQGRFPSLGVNAQMSGHATESGLQEVKYCHYMSWKGADTPSPCYDDPAYVFRLLFGEASSPTGTTTRETLQREKRKNIIDFILPELKSLRTQLGANDKIKVDEYITGVEEISRDLTRLPANDPVTGSCSPPASYQTISKSFETYPQRFKILQDLMIKALECDKTRIFLFMHMSATHAIKVPWVPGIDARELETHGLSHGRPGSIQFSNFQKLLDWQYTSFVNLLKELDRRIDPNGKSMLYNSIVMFGSEHSNGEAHNGWNMPFLVAGNAGGRMKTGFTKTLKVPTGNLYLTFMKMMGLNINQYGNSNGVVADLMV